MSYQIRLQRSTKTDRRGRERGLRRVNKYTVNPSQSNELRREPIFPGTFLTVSGTLGTEMCILIVTPPFSPPPIDRRYADVKYISELLAAMIDGIQDKKTSLDDFYTKYAQVEETG